MRKIKIFIGSSIEELKEDRIAIGNFFRQLNDLYLDNGLYFQLIMCEDYDDAIELEGKQSKYDKEIEDSELSVFIFYKKVGVYTEHEFEIAFDHFKAEHRPKILTVFKCVNDASEIVESVKDFASRLDKEYKHYYKTYTNTDSLKLWLIMQIKSMGLDQSIVEFSGGKVMINGESVASYSAAPAFSEHSELKAKKERLAALKDEYIRLKAEYLENPDDIDVYVKYSQLSKEKTALESEINDAEQKIVEQLQNIYTVTARGGLSERQIIGYRLIDAGKYDEALEILNKDEIFGDIAASERMLDYGQKIVENAMADLQTGVNELKQRIDTLKVKGVTAENEGEIISLYERVCELSGKYGLDLESYLWFADFYYKQGKPKKGYEMLFAAKEMFEKIKDFDLKANYWRMLALVASGCGHREEAYQYRLKTLKIIEGLLMIEETDKRLEIYAKTHHSQYFYYGYQSEQAKNHALEAKRVFEILYQKNPQKYAKMLAGCESILSIAARGDEKKQYLERCASLLSERIDAGDATDDEKSQYISSLKNYCSCVVDDGGDFSDGSDARGMMDKALEMAKELAAKNPNAYEKLLANVVSAYGRLLFDKASCDLAEPYLVLAYESYKKLYAENETQFIYSHSLAAERLGNFYENRDKEKSERYYRIAIEGYERCGSDEIECNERSHASAYYDAAILYLRKFSDYESCARCYKKALEIYEALPDQNDKDRMWIGYINDDIKDYGLGKYFK